MSPVSAESVFTVATIAGRPPALFDSFDIASQIMLKASGGQNYMTHSRPVRSLLLLLSLTTFVTVTNAQVQIKPARDPNQPIDQEYTNKIREYTTAPYFNSTLTNYLPA